MTAHVLMYSTGVCPYCTMAERLLKSKGIEEIEKVRIDLDMEQRNVMMQRTGRRTVPQIYIGDTHVGGFDDLAALERLGTLDALLQGT
ncbi:MAG: glutaredoxin 3 [Bradyrhizobium sp.]|jgi:glutaredoxin 3|uniref:glutaredoxin 3 n=1 Tax=Actimicrobium sp. CCI2.3 TaxID=3048616 RepID=UPI002AB3731B|nr:glutaredoxin 3 [Actimicrobium sp. CCI2.3]MDY7576381.1 glutaredoxin 3 [Actimicrobium sp. CCI2.3]MEB0020415.1 glutaredoxin 3 [Actimicrobium sp. CCI2.3]